jgi:hypothetical protein
MIKEIKMDKTIIPQDFYVYLHRKATTNEVFYVGKGHGRRAWEKHGRSKIWQNTSKKHGLIVEIAYSGLKEWASLEIECDLISLYGRKDLGLGQLVNYTDGGEGVCGLVHTQKAREAVRLAHLGHTRNKGRILSDQHKEKLKAHLYGNQYTKGHKLTEEHKRKVKETLNKNGWPNSKKVIHIESGIIFRSCADAIRWLKKEKNIIAAPMTFSQNLKKSRAVFGELFSVI